MTTHERERLAALHEYRLLDAPAGETPGGGTTIAVTLPAAEAVPAVRR